MVPTEIRQKAFGMLQSLARQWIGKIPPDRIQHEMKLLEAIAYLDGTANLHVASVQEPIRNPISFAIPAGENSDSAREIKTGLHKEAVKIHTKMFMDYIQKYPQVFGKIAENHSK